MAGALIGALRVSLSAETSAFEAGMKRSQRQAKATANSIVSDFKSAGGAMNALRAGVAGFVASLSVGTIIAAGKAALDYAGSLGEISQQLGVTTKDLQVLRYAAGQTGVSQAELETGLSKLAITLGKVAAGAKAPTAALDAIGVSADQLKNKDTGEALRIIADGLANVEDRSQRAAIEVALFGRSGAKLDTLLAGGSRQINELSDAAERLGIVLSEEQIQRADDTADKLDALKTVLAAKIAGEVADNADSILGLADALVELVNWAGRASDAWVNFTNNLARKWSLPAQFNRLVKGEVFGFNTPGQSVTVPLGAAKRAPAPRVANSGSIPQFMGGGGGGGRRGGGGRDRSAEEALRKQLDALRDQNQFDQDILRAKRDVLQAQLSLAKNADDRANIDLEILASERREYEGQLAYEVKVNQLTKGAEGISQAQADQLLELYGITEGYKRQAILQEQHEANLETVARLADVDYDIQREKLDLEAGLAETASEQRDVQLRLLDLWYRQERAKLDAIMAEEAIGSAAWEEARRRRAALDANQGARRANVEAGTRGPLEDYMSSLPSTTEKWNEALEGVAANGLKSVEDGLVDILTGTKSVGDALHDMLGQIIQDLIRLGIQRAISMAIGGGGIGFATGGFVSGPGTATSDSIPAMLSNGEYVVNSRAVGSFGVPFFNGINSGQITPQMLGGAGGGGGGFLEGAAGMGLFGAAGLLATGKKLPIFGLAGKLFGFSKGGLVGGLSLPRTRMGERVSVSNDNGRMRGGDTFQFSFPGVSNAREARTAGIQAAGAFKQQIARAVRIYD